ncbi:extracellular solute-binding protein [bacterium]|nr:MAG: extracellular solute-binding protein [bacterium]
MRSLDRREFLVGTGAVAATAAGVLLDTAGAQAAAYTPMFTPESGAKLQLLRWSGFVKSDEAAWNANTQLFTKLTGIPVEVQYLSWTDVSPKAALSAQVNSGPDIVMGWYDAPFIYPDKLVDVSDLANYLGHDGGGWYPVSREYGYDTKERRWIAVPIGVAGAAAVYRKSWVEQAGFHEFPKNLGGLLKLSKALKKNGHPCGLALGHAVGDANTWAHSLLWGFGGKQVNPDGSVAINSPQTVHALEYAKELYETMIPGVSSWLDPSNNKAFLAGDISWTINGISIWVVAKESFPQIFADTINAPIPMGPVNRPTPFNLFTQAFIFKYSSYPKAAKEYLRFMLERKQADAWVTAMNGYVTPAARGYRSLPVWTSNPNVTPYRDAMVGELSDGFAGAPGKEAATALNDFIVVDMFADACVNDMPPKQAIQRAENRLKAIYG